RPAVPATRRRPGGQVTAGGVAQQHRRPRRDVGQARQQLDARRDVVEGGRGATAVADTPVLEVEHAPAPGRQVLCRRAAQREVVAGPPEPAVDDHHGPPRPRHRRPLGVLRGVRTVVDPPGRGHRGRKTGSRCWNICNGTCGWPSSVRCRVTVTTGPSTSTSSTSTCSAYGARVATL